MISAFSMLNGKKVVGAGLPRCWEFFSLIDFKRYSLCIVTSFTFCKCVSKTYFNFLEQNLMKTHKEKIISQWKLLKILVTMKNFHFCTLFVVNFRDPISDLESAFLIIYIEKNGKKEGRIIIVSKSQSHIRMKQLKLFCSCGLDLYCTSFIDCCNLLVRSL